MNTPKSVADAVDDARKASTRAALVTGAARGLGLAIATRLGHLGHPVVLLDASDDVETSAAQLRSDGIDAQGLRVDVSQDDEVRALPARLQALGTQWERLSILVNNAGISPKTDGRKRLVSDMPADEWRRVLAVNLTGAFLVTQTCLPRLCAHGWGRVVMITSQAARTRTPVPGAHYSASKAGLTGFARVLAGEIAVHGVTVNCVAPGRIASAMTAAIDPRQNAALAELIPVGRLGLPEEVAATVAFLVSEGAGYLTGASLDVNGGNFMA
ncbi:MAG: SDR family oxidoreductase [Gammaproteobacteria bacterium]|nr:SDR family oxidoreductase [Gammaproteobacteria bacterium]MBU1443747.1 SDR family oxidoreductase [Gammaproteobacteria bacterium]MBU2285669.1 SDR family oxidoreductase [Gammaproteobacteria bacterium]